MDATDKKILNSVQGDFPIEAEPFQRLSERLGIDADEIIARLGKLKKEGVIRRIGAVFDTRALGFVSTLCAARVNPEKLDEFVAVVNACPGVTHNYLRNHAYNVWFTLIASSQSRLAEDIAAIKQKTGIDDILSLPVSRQFKINARFEV